MGFGWLGAGVGLVIGLLAGSGIRLLLARLRRGVQIRPGELEAASSLVTAVGIGLVWPAPTAVLVVWTGLLGVTLGAVDLVHHRLPDAITIPAVPITMLLLVVVQVAAPATGSLLRALIVAGTVTAAFWLLHRLSPRAMGRGDVKLVPTIALLTGFVSVAAAVLALTVAFVLGAVVALLGLLTRRLSLTSAIAFGPFLLVACWLVLALPELVAAVAR